MGVTEQLFWNSVDVCHGFQRVDSLACVLCRLHATGSQTLKATYQTPPTTSGSGFYACNDSVRNEIVTRHYGDRSVYHNGRKDAAPRARIDVLKVCIVILNNDYI